MIAGAAELYGGDVQPWDSPEGKQWQIITNATRIPVVLPPNPPTQNTACCRRRVWCCFRGAARRPARAAAAPET